jgi:hypothetical protein
MLHSTHYYLRNMNQCPQYSTQLIITYEIWTSFHNAALNSLLLTKYEPVSTMQHWTHYCLRNMNQCPQCCTELLITYEIWTSVHNSALNSLLLMKYEPMSTMRTAHIINNEICISVHNAALNSLLLTVDTGSYFVSNNELSAALWTLVHIS